MQHHNIKQISLSLHDSILNLIILNLLYKYCIYSVYRIYFLVMYAPVCIP